VQVEAEVLDKGRGYEGQLEVCERLADTRADSSACDTASDSRSSLRRDVYILKGKKWEFISGEMSSRLTYLPAVLSSRTQRRGSIR